MPVIPRCLLPLEHKTWRGHFLRTKAVKAAGKYWRTADFDPLKSFVQTDDVCISHTILVAKNSQHRAIMFVVESVKDFQQSRINP